MLIAAVLAHALVNVLGPHAFIAGDQWQYANSVPVIRPIGVDLRFFLQASRTMFAGGNPLGETYVSPPLTAAIFYPLSRFPADLAYRIQFVLLAGCNLAVLAVLASLTRRALVAERMVTRGDAEAILRPVLFTAAVFQFFGYPLEFALERGNYDSYALLAIVLGLWFATQARWNLWLPVVLFSVAAHLKVYPAIFLLLPLWQHRWRAAVPCIVVNCAMLFSFGFARATQFLAELKRLSMEPYFWPGNHSAACFVNEVLEPLLRGHLPEPAVHPAAILIAVVLPVALWLHGTIRLMKGGFGAWPALLWAALSTPIMSIVPSTSHDYKLVIMVLPAFVCLAGFAVRLVCKGGRLPIVAIAATLFAMLFIARSVLYPWILGIGNKYPVVVLLEVCAYVAVLWRAPAGSALAPADADGAQGRIDRVTANPS
jgi:hypothetical protein